MMSLFDLDRSCFCLFIVLLWSSMTEPIQFKGRDITYGSTSKLYCGGILDDFVSLCSNCSDIGSAAKFAAAYALKRHPQSLPLDENGKIVQWQVLEAKKLKLQFTKDGINPFIFEEVTERSSGPQIHHRQAILGITYTFTLAWPTIPNSFTHRFIVNKDREHHFFVHAHYFYKSIMPTNLDVGKQKQYSAATDLPEPLAQASLPGSVLFSKGSCIDQSDCSSQDFVMAAGTLDQSEVGQSECRDASTHNVWTENERQENTKATKEGHEFGRFLTYNIWNFNSLPQEGNQKFYPKRIAHMGKLLIGSMSDVIGMQEVRYDHKYSSITGPSQAAQLAEYLKDYQFVYQPATTYWQGHLGRMEEGLIIFSRHSIVSHDYILLPRNESDPEEGPHQRICLHAAVDHPTMGIVHVFVSHLSLSKVARERSVVEIWRYMQQFTGPAVLMGDLNAEPHEASMRFLRGEMELLGHRTEGMLDAWRVFHDEPRPDAPGTYKWEEPRDLGLTFSALESHLRKRIDFVYIRLTDETKLVDVSLVDDGLRGQQAASDHIGVAAVIAPSMS